ncbi:MAG TPA: DUF4190 domain-containing protein [Acidimicrobiia bacterium]|jgi:hypothetical protein
MTNGDAPGERDPIPPYGTSNVPEPPEPPGPPGPPPAPVPPRSVAPGAPPTVTPPPIVPPAPPPAAPGSVPQRGTPPWPGSPRARTSALAVSSLVLGIVGFFLITALLAVIFGHVALSQVKRSFGAIGGRGMAIAGLVLGYLWLAFFAAIIALAATGVIQTATPEACRDDRLAITVAEEAYHTVNGHYTDQRTLVDNGYLSDESDLHSVVLQGTPTNATAYFIADDDACD